MDFAALFELDVNPFELFIRVSVIWWFVFLVLRFLLKRDIGQVGAADVLLLVLVADGVSTGMQDDYSSITSGLIVAATLFFWNWLMDTLAMHYEWANTIMEPPPVVLVKNGRYRHRELRKHKLKVDDVQQAIRKAGYPNVNVIKYVRFESDGQFSVVPKDKT